MSDRKRPNLGSSLDSFLEENGLLGEVSATAAKRVPTMSMQSAFAKSSQGNEIIKGLIEAINQRGDPQLCDEAYSAIMKQIDELMEMNGGEGPESESEDRVLLEILAETAEAYEEGLG